MGEFVSEDVLDWARDLAAIARLFAGESVRHNHPLRSAKIFDLSMLRDARHGCEPVDQLDSPGAA